MKFLTSLVYHSRQPARRAGTPGSLQQPEAFKPWNPFQESLPVQPDTQPMQTHPRQPADQVPDMTAAPAETLRQQPETGSETEADRSGARQKTRATQDLPGMPVDQASAEPGFEKTVLHPRPGHLETNHSVTAVSRNEAEDLPPVIGKPASATGQTKVSPANGAAHERVAGPSDKLNPEASQLPQRGQGAVVAQPSSVASEPAGSGVSGSPADASVSFGPTQDPGTLDAPQPVNQFGRQVAEAELSSNGPQHRPQVEDDLRPVQVALQQPSSVRSNPLPRRAVQQDQNQQIPQVRIGQINVLVEDQTPASPKTKKSASKPALVNPFGLRGL